MGGTGLQHIDIFVFWSFLVGALVVDVKKHHTLSKDHLQKHHTHTQGEV